MPGPYNIDADITAGDTGHVEHHEALASAINESATAATPNVIILRDAAGRAKVADPSVAADIATKGYVDTGLGGKANTSHTHTASQVTDFEEVVRDTMGTALVAGTNITITPNDAGDTITIAASGGGGSTVLWPPRVPVNMWQHPEGVFSITAGSNQFSTAYQGVIPFVVTQAMSIDRIAVNVTTADAAATLGVAMWGSDSNGMPLNLITSGTGTPSATGILAVTVSASLTPGIYWVGVAASSAATLRLSGCLSTFNFTGQSSAPRASTSRGFQISGGAYNTPTTTLGAPVNSGADNTIWVAIRRSA